MTYYLSAVTVAQMPPVFHIKVTFFVCRNGGGQCGRITGEKTQKRKKFKDKKVFKRARPSFCLHPACEIPHFYYTWLTHTHYITSLLSAISCFISICSRLCCQTQAISTFITVYTMMYISTSAPSINQASAAVEELSLRICFSIKIASRYLLCDGVSKSH